MFVSKCKTVAATLLALVLVGGGAWAIGPFLVSNGAENTSAPGPVLPRGSDRDGNKDDPMNAGERPAPPPALAEITNADLTARWDSSAGHRGKEWLVAFSKDGKLAFFDQPSGRLIARDTT